MKICALGDSIFAGYLVNGKSLIYYLKNSDYDVDNYGINGLTSSELLSAINNIINYDVYLIHIGLNDILNGDSLEIIIKNILSIITHLQKLGGKIYLCSPYKLDFNNVSNSLSYFANFKSANRKIEKLDNTFKEWESKKDINVISFYDYSINNYIGEKLIDGIHPNEELHKLLADYVEDKINGYL